MVSQALNLTIQPQVLLVSGEMHFHLPPISVIYNPCGADSINSTEGLKT